MVSEILQRTRYVFQFNPYFQCGNIYEFAQMIERREKKHRIPNFNCAALSHFLSSHYFVDFISLSIHSVLFLCSSSLATMHAVYTFDISVSLIIHVQCSFHIIAIIIYVCYGSQHATPYIDAMHHSHTEVANL